MADFKICIKLSGSCFKDYLCYMHGLQWKIFKLQFILSNKNCFFKERVSKQTTGFFQPLYNNLYWILCPLSKMEFSGWKQFLTHIKINLQVFSVLVFKPWVLHYRFMPYICVLICVLNIIIVPANPPLIEQNVQYS